MHRRNSTRSGAIDRRKSTSSVKSVQLEHILPDTAERDAQAAAAQAFARAKDRSAVDAPLWPPSRNYVSSRATGFIGTPDRRTDDTPLRRQQSVRFVRPAPTQLSRSYTRGEDLTPTRKPNTVRLQVTTRGVEPCPASTATTAGMTCAAKGAAGDYISALITGEEYYTPEDDIASAPSSYRRIRKSKSMFSGSQTTMLPPNHMGYRTSATMNQLPSPSPGYAGPRTDENKPPVGLKAPKSMSFLRSRREQPMPHPDHQGEMPHASSTNEFSGTYNPKGKLLKAQPSTFFRSKRASTDRTFRKSMRDVSNHAMSTTGQPSKEGSLRHKARKVSLNLKHKLKNLFSSTKGENDESMLPPQQIEARKSHVTGSDSLEEDFNDEFRPTPTAEEDTIRTTSEEEQPGSPEFNPWMRSISDLPMRCPSTCESEVDKKMHYAESIYSSTTEDQTNGIDNGLSAPKYSPPRPPSVHGDATIFVDPPVYRSQPVPFKRRMTSTASSVEWKSWLSANVSKLKESPVVPETSRLDYTLPVALFSGHVREKAQMNDEEEDQHPPEVYEPSRPGTVHASTVPDAETLSPVIQEALRDDSQAPGSKKQNEASEPPPPPPKSILRTAPSVASMGSARTVSKPLTENTNKEKVGAMDQKFLAHMSSLNALSGNQSRGGTPGTVKLVKRQPRPKGSNTSLSSPGLANAVERQFGKLEGSIRSKQNNTHAHPNSENVSPHVGGDDDPYGINGAVVLGPDETEDGQGVGSKRMVDFFLSSRRKRMASSDEGEVFL
ncbi:Uu.00g114040.m01.CDS01 [Anthostomella pinea]|uniref:Uu.00g114040.m01.CDS01 n=1 Tax=Anthostomella pinea TaxID=933095 RepID=A0AAI8VFL4_9PEZI|nr:Uu.00g114040.m01.CDS01 [Anthostomella pinea]